LQSPDWDANDVTTVEQVEYEDDDDDEGECVDWNQGVQMQPSPGRRESAQPWSMDQEDEEDEEDDEDEEDEEEGHVDSPIPGVSPGLEPSKGKLGTWWQEHGRRELTPIGEEDEEEEEEWMREVSRSRS